MDSMTMMMMLEILMKICKDKIIANTISNTHLITMVEKVEYKWDLIKEDRGIIDPIQVK